MCGQCNLGIIFLVIAIIIAITKVIKDIIIMRYYKTAKSPTFTLRNYIFLLFFSIYLFSVYLCSSNASSLLLRAMIECFGMIFALIIVNLIFVRVYYKNVVGFINASKNFMCSQYSSNKLKQAHAFTKLLPYALVVVITLDVMTLIYEYGNREIFSTTMLAINDLYLLILVVYKGYVLDCIIIFGSECFLSGANCVRYCDISKAIQTATTKTIQGPIVKFKVMNEGGQVIGHDRMMQMDYCLLKDHIIEE